MGTPQQQHQLQLVSSLPADDNTKSKFQNLEMEGGGRSSSYYYTTRDGSLDYHEKQTLKKGRGRGGWRCGLLILGNVGIASLGLAGVEVNMVLFAKSVMRQTNAEAANTFSRWLGTTSLFSLSGALLSDSYLGRYLTCVVFQLTFILGVVLLSLSAHLFLLKPDGCGTLSSPCDHPNQAFQQALFYISIYLIALGFGAFEPAIAAFGADQFDDEDAEPNNKNHSKTSFYSYYYVAVNLGCLAGETVLAYIENLGYWMIGFWICCGASTVGYLLLLSGTLRYKHFKPSGNPISSFCQVIVASFRNMGLEVPPNGHGLYDEDIAAVHGRRIPHTAEFMFLDRAAIPSPVEIEKRSLGQSLNPWRLCTVTQVEEVKCILRLLPIWFCSMISAVVFVQVLSLFVEQGAAMDTTIGSHNFQFPPASMTAFDMITASTFILLYDKLILPSFLYLTNNKSRQRHSDSPNELQRMGFGLAIGVIAMIVAGVVERMRLRCVVSNGKLEMSRLSIFWIAPQYILVGVSEALVYVAQMEFFASQTPAAMQSLGMGLPMSSTALGNYLCSILLTVVMKISTRNGEEAGWVPANLNEGHLDRFYFLLAGLMVFNLGIFMVVSRKFKCMHFSSGTLVEKR